MRSTGQTGKFQFAQSDSSGMWDGLRRCSEYLAGSFENSFLLGTGRPRLLCCRLGNGAKFLQRGKNLARPEFSMGKHLTVITVRLLKHLQHCGAVGGIRSALWEERCR